MQTRNLIKCFLLFSLLIFIKFNGVIFTGSTGEDVTTASDFYNPTIGEIFQGGKVFYILQSGDPGYDVTTPHGLIAANWDQSTRIGWYNGNDSITRATQTKIGTGLSNSNMVIITSQVGTPITDYAAGLARAYNGGGYTDWYLPSKEELYKLFLNKDAIGGFEYNIYWSSTEDELKYEYAWYQSFSNGLQQSDNKMFPAYVRAIRAF